MQAILGAFGADDQRAFAGDRGRVSHIESVQALAVDYVRAAKGPGESLGVGALAATLGADEENGRRGCRRRHAQRC